MNVEVLGPTVVKGLIERTVQFHEELPSGHGQTVQVSVWVAESDTYSTLNAAALAQARGALERALAAPAPFMTCSARCRSTMGSTGRSNSSSSRFIASSPSLGWRRSDG
jgi:hypothetical protein